MQTSKPELRAAVVSVSRPEDALLHVGGLTVLERNVRLLEQSGFIVFHAPEQPVGGAEGRGRLLLDGGIQYGLATFARIKRSLDVDPDGDRVFRFGLDEGIAVAWETGTGPRRTERFEDLAAIVPSAVVAADPRLAPRRLLDAFFDEIFFHTEGWVARGLNKKISFRLTRFFLRTSVTPNQITLATFALGLVGCLLLLSPSWAVRAFGALLIQINSILDGCDGEVARIKVQSSRLGAWLDTIADDVLNNVMFGCLTLGLFFHTGNPAVLRLGLATTLASLGMSAFLYHYMITHGTANAAHYRLSWEKSLPEPGGVPGLFDRVKPLLKRDFFILVVLVFIVLDLRLALLTIAALPVWIGFFLYLASFAYAFVNKARTDPRTAPEIP